jgi:hypothetical protein
MKGFPFACAFESHVFPKVGNALVGQRFISAANVKHNAAMNNFSCCNMIVHHTDAVFQGIDFVVSHILINTFSDPKITELNGKNLAKIGSFWLIFKLTQFIPQAEFICSKGCFLRFFFRQANSQLF